MRRTRGDVKGVFTRICQLSNAIKTAVEGTGKKLMEYPNYCFIGLPVQPRHRSAR